MVIFYPKNVVVTSECFFSFDDFEVHSDDFFGLLMRFGYDDGSWEFYVFDFGLYVSEICLFLCLSLMRSFVVQIFSFSRTLCG